MLCDCDCVFAIAVWICALIVLFSHDSYSFCCVEFVVACMFVCYWFAVVWLFYDSLVLFVCYCSVVVAMILVVALVCVFGLLVCGCMLLVFVVDLRVLYWCWFGFGIACLLISGLCWFRLVGSFLRLGLCGRRFFVVCVWLLV